MNINEIHLEGLNNTVVSVKKPTPPRSINKKSPCILQHYLWARRIAARLMD